MLWVFEVCAALFFGYQFVSRAVGNGCDFIERVAIGIPVGLFTLAWLAYVTSVRVVVGPGFGLIWTGILSASGVALKAWNSRLRLTMKAKASKVYVWTCLLMIVFLGVVLWVAMLFDNRFSLGAGYGDLPFHLNIISSFSVGCNRNRTSMFDVKTSFYAGEPLAYPFITNYLSSILVSTGQASIRISLLVPSMLIMVSLVIGMFSLLFEFTRDEFATSVAFFLFINLGGHGWTRILTMNIVNEEFAKEGPDFIHHWPGHQYEYWFHCLFHVLVPQRASLFSMPLCYWTFLLLIQGFQHKSLGKMFIAGVLTGFTPLVQVHSYVAIAQWAITYCAITFPYKQSRQWQRTFLLWAVFGITANVMAFPQFLPYLNRLTTNDSSFLRLDPIWKGQSPFRLWWYGLGVFAPIALVFGWIELDRRQLLLYIPSILVFLLANVIRYQPWELDNLKVFYAGWIPLALGVVSQYLVKLWDTATGSILSMALLLLSCFSGFLSTIINISSPAAIFDKTSDWQLGRWISENTDVTSVFLVNPTHMHPAATIAGRQLYMGYPGWVASHGLEYTNRQHQNSHLGMNSAPEGFTSEHITYVISHDHFAPLFETDVIPNPQWVKVFSNDIYHVWRLDHF